MSDIRSFKREHELSPTTPPADRGDGGAAARTPRSSTCAPRTTPRSPPRSRPSRRPATRPEDEEEADAGTTRDSGTTTTSPSAAAAGGAEDAGAGAASKALEGTFDHGDEGYGLWLDPAIQDDPVYAEHWAGHRPVTVRSRPSGS